MSDKQKTLTAEDLETAALVLRIRSEQIEKTVQETGKIIGEETTMTLYKYLNELSMLSAKFSVFAAQMKAEMISLPPLKE